MMSVGIMIHWSFLLLVFVFVTDCSGTPVPSVPLNMWIPGVFPAGTPILTAKQAALVSQSDDRLVKSPVMRDLSRSVGQLDMADEFRVPYVSNFALEDPDMSTRDEHVEENPQDKHLGKDESSKTNQPTDRILASKTMSELERPRLLYGYGTSSAVALVPVVQKTYQPQVLVPLAVPVIQNSLTPVIQTPKASIQSSAAVQPTITHSQQAISIGAQTVPQAQPQETQQSRMVIPQAAQSVQPIGQPQPVVQAQPVIQPQQPSASLPGQGRFEWPTSNVAGPQLSQPQTVETRTVQQNQQPQTQQQQQPQQQQQSSRIVIKHQFVPQHIHIVLPKKRSGYGNYGGYAGY